MNTYKKLADAMRKGAALRPQYKDGEYFGDTGDGIGSCALGAAYEGLTGKITDTLSLSEIARLFPVLNSFTPVIHPTANRPWDLFLTILELNDDHGWTREAIADWLDTL